MSEIELNMNNVRILVDNLRGLKFTESPRWRDARRRCDELCAADTTLSEQRKALGEF